MPTRFLLVLIVALAVGLGAQTAAAPQRATLPRACKVLKGALEPSPWWAHVHHTGSPTGILSCVFADKTFNAKWRASFGYAPYSTPAKALRAYKESLKHTGHVTLHDNWKGADHAYIQVVSHTEPMDVIIGWVKGRFYGNFEAEAPTDEPNEYPVFARLMHSMPRS